MNLVTSNITIQYLPTYGGLGFEDLIRREQGDSAPAEQVDFALPLVAIRRGAPGNLTPAGRPEGASGGQLLPPKPRTPQDLAFDLIQMALDLLGVVDPTPITDAASLVMAVIKRDWVGAGISAVSMIPAIGDTFKSAKLAGMAELMEEAVRYMVKHPAQAPVIRDLLTSPLFGKMLRAVKHVLDHADLPPPARQALEQIARIIEDARRL